MDRPAPRHLKALALYAQGLTREEVGRELIVSPETVKAYLSQACELLDARNSRHAVTLCIARGYLCVDCRTETAYVPAPLDDLVAA